MAKVGLKYGEEPYLECSTSGDPRFSAFVARIKARGNNTIERIYQGSKVFADGTTGLHPLKAKGRHAVNAEEVRVLYAKLWDEYIRENPELLEVLRSASGLSDIYGQKGHACQAEELWRIRNDESFSMKPVKKPRRQIDEEEM